MKKVGFLGDFWVLDNKLYDKVYYAIDELASKETALNFMFFCPIIEGKIMNKFIKVCYQAVVDFGKANPDKQIVKTKLVGNPEEVENWSDKSSSYDMFDRCFCPVADIKEDFLTAVIHHADYMICQLYNSMLNKTEQKYFNMVEEEKRIMVTSEAVERRIRELLLRLPESTQVIFERISAGDTYTSLVEEMGVSYNAVRERHRYAIVNIKRCLAGEKSIFD